MPPARPASLKVRALQWLSQREHSRSELRDKLLRLLERSAPPDTAGDDTADRADPQIEVDTLLVWLEERGYLSDARFAESRVQARQARYGNQRIRQELRQRGVALDAAAEAELAGTEFSRAWAVWQRKYDAPATDPAGRLRQMRFLVGRGFSMDAVQQVLRQATRCDPTAPGDHLG
jgi:regulatory protein